MVGCMTGKVWEWVWDPQEPSGTTMPKRGGRIYFHEELWTRGFGAATQAEWGGNGACRGLFPGQHGADLWPLFSRDSDTEGRSFFDLWGFAVHPGQQPREKIRPRCPKKLILDEAGFFQPLVCSLMSGIQSYNTLDIPVRGTLIGKCVPWCVCLTPVTKRCKEDRKYNGRDNPGLCQSCTGHLAGFSAMCTLDRNHTHTKKRDLLIFLGGSLTSIFTCSIRWNLAKELDFLIFSTRIIHRALSWWSSG